VSPLRCGTRDGSVSFDADQRVMVFTPPPA